MDDHAASSLAAAIIGTTRTFAMGGEAPRRRAD